MPIRRSFALRRRALIAGATVGLAAPAIGIGARAETAPTIVVGAGVAGLTAAGLLAAAGRTTIVLEATGRVGGRAITARDGGRAITARGGRHAVTARDGLPVPVDLGAAWLHSSDRNPLTPVVRAQGAGLSDEGSGPFWLRLDGADAPDADYDRLDAAWDRFWAAMDAAPAGIAAAAASPIRDRWDRLVHALEGPLEQGLDTAELSALALTRQIGTGAEHLVPTGLGAALAAGLAPAWAAAPAPGAAVLRLNSPVAAIRWGGAGPLTLTVGGHSLPADQVLITVSLGVLAGGGIAFDPPLPADRRAALAGLRMGVLEKAILAFDGPLPVAANTTLLATDGPAGPVDAILLNPAGLPLAVAFFGGDPARVAVADAQGRAGLLTHLRGRLTDALGRLPAERGATVTAWSADPFFRGAYSAVPPGAEGAQAVLAAPLDDRLFLAGEAMPGPWTTQVAGAHLSARQAVAAMLAAG